MIPSLLTVVRIAIGRIIRQPWLALFTVVGLAAAIGLSTGVPLYSGTVYNRLLQTELAAQRPSSPPFALLFRYLGTRSGAVTWADVQPVDAYLMDRAAAATGLPAQLAVSFLNSGEFDFFSSADTDGPRRYPVATLSFASQSELDRHITLVQGRLPAAPAEMEGSAIEVLLSERLALILGWGVGDTYVAYAGPETADLRSPVQFPVRIVGIWRATNHRDPYWFLNPTRVPEDTLVVSEAAFSRQLDPWMIDAGGSSVSAAIWYLVLNGDAFRPNQADAFDRHLQVVQSRADRLLPETVLLVSPASAALQRYQATSRWLTLALFACEVPVLGAVAAFLSMVIGLSVRQQRAETAMLRSRGATEAQILGIAAVQGLFLGAVAWGLGVPSGRLVARLMAGARGFLVFVPGAELSTAPWSGTVILGAIIAASAPLGYLGLTSGLLEHSVVAYRREQTRAVRAPWWERGWLDFLLLLVAAYGVYALRQHGLAPDPLSTGADAAEMIRRNPLLFAVPALGAIALALLGLRLLPASFDAIGQVAAQTPSTALLLALRQVARSPSAVRGPLLLLTLTFTLACFTASWAVTLDTHESARARERIGADASLMEYGENTESELEAEIQRRCNVEPGFSCPRGPNGVGLALTEEHFASLPRWRMLPVTDHLAVPGIRSAARVGVYPARVAALRGAEAGVFVGVDRGTFPLVALWDASYAPEALGSLMNELALAPDRVLVSHEFAAQQGLRAGDAVAIAVTIPEGRKAMPYRDVELVLTVAAVVDGFPAWTADQGPLLVGNLDFVFQEAGGQYPYRVWLDVEVAADLRTDPGAAVGGIVEAVRDQGFNVVTWDAPAASVSAAQARPERQGMFGMLSAGFLVAAVLTLLGLVLSTFFSLRQRSIELGMLRALGLPHYQVTLLILWELAILIGLGSLGGTAIGLMISRVAIPYLPLGIGDIAGSGVRPTVQFAWSAMVRVYAMLALVGGALVVLVSLMVRRTRAAEAIQLGLTV